MILAIETSSQTGGLALIENGEISAQTEWTHVATKDSSQRSSHSEVITDQFQSLLQNHGSRAQDLKALIVDTGPGSFTGIRVGMNFAKSLAYCLDLPVYPLNSLESLAFGCELQGGVLSLLNAYRNMVYLAGYHRDSRSFTVTLSPQALSVKDLQISTFAPMDEFAERRASGPIQVVGDGLETYQSILPQSLRDQWQSADETPTHSRVEHLCALYLHQNSGEVQLQPIDWKVLQPLYLRPSSAEENQQSGLLKPLPSLDLSNE